MKLKILAAALFVISTSAQGFSTAGFPAQNPEQMRDDVIHNINVLNSANSSVKELYSQLQSSIKALENSKFIDPGMPSGQLALNIDGIDEIMRDIKKTQDNIDLMDELAPTLKALKTAGDVAGGVIDIYTVHNATKVLTDDNSGILDKINEAGNLAAIAVSRTQALSKIAGSALVPYEGSKLIVERSLDSARNTAEQISQSYQTDLTSFQNQMRSLTHNIIIENLALPKQEVQEKVFEAIRSLAAEYIDDYSEGGVMYKAAFGKNSFFGYLSTDGSITKQFRGNEDYFSRYLSLGGDAYQHAKSTFDRKFDELVTFKTIYDLADQLQNELTVINKASSDLQYNLLEISLTPLENKNTLTTQYLSKNNINDSSNTEPNTETEANIATYQDEIKTDLIEKNINLATEDKNNPLPPYDKVTGRTEGESGGDAIDIETSGNLSLTYSESNIATLNISSVKGNQQNGFMQTSAQASMGPDHSPREIENVYEPDVAYGAEEYSYTEWGRWSGNDPDYPFYENKSGYVVLGVPTPDDYLPDATGTATYTGDVIGAYSGGSYGDGYLGGRTRLTADFDTNTIEGALFLNRIYSAGETEQMRTVTFEYEIDQQGGYGGMLTVDENPGAGQLYGEFYGPKAEETGGAFVFSHQDAGNRNELVEGVYRATKTAGSDLSR